MHNNGQATTIPSQPAVPVFDDTKTSGSTPTATVRPASHSGRYQPGWYSVNLPKTGTTIEVKSGSHGAQSFLTLEVRPSGGHGGGGGH